MSERMTMTRRALMNTAAAAGAAGMLDGIAQAQAPTTNLPAANEVLIRDAFVISMNPAIAVCRMATSMSAAAPLSRSAPTSAHPARR